MRLLRCPRPMRSLLKPKPPPPPPPPPPPMPPPFPLPPPLFPRPLVLKIVERRHSDEELRKISMYLNKRQSSKSEICPSRSCFKRTFLGTQSCATTGRCQDQKQEEPQPFWVRFDRVVKTFPKRFSAVLWWWNTVVVDKNLFRNWIQI